MKILDIYNHHKRLIDVLAYLRQLMPGIGINLDEHILFPKSFSLYELGANLDFTSQRVIEYRDLSDDIRRQVYIDPRDVPFPENENILTVVLDLDGTLIDAELIDDVILEEEGQNIETKAFVYYIRPYTDFLFNILKKLKEDGRIRVVLWTAASGKYGPRILKDIDPHGVIEHVIIGNSPDGRGNWSVDKRAEYESVKYLGWLCGSKKVLIDNTSLCGYLNKNSFLHINDFKVDDKYHTDEEDASDSYSDKDREEMATVRSDDKSLLVLSLMLLDIIKYCSQENFGQQYLQVLDSFVLETEGIFKTSSLRLLSLAPCPVFPEQQWLRTLQFDQQAVNNLVRYLDHMRSIPCVTSSLTEKQPMGTPVLTYAGSKIDQSYDVRNASNSSNSSILTLTSTSYLSQLTV